LAATVTTAATAVAATTAAASLTGLGLVDVEGATTEVAAVEGADGLASVLIGHLDEAEAARAAGLAVGREGDRDHLTVLREHLGDLRLSGVEREVTHINLLNHDLVLLAGMPA